MMGCVIIIVQEGGCMERQLTIHDVVDRLIVGGNVANWETLKARVWRAIREGTLPACKDPGETGAYHMDPKDVEAWLAGSGGRNANV